MRIALPYLLWGRSATSNITAILGLEMFVCLCVSWNTDRDNALSYTYLGLESWTGSMLARTCKLAFRRCASKIWIPCCTINMNNNNIYYSQISNLHKNTSSVDYITIR